MKALRFDRFDLSTLRVEEIPKPRPGAEEVLVRVRAASINPSDVKNVLGKFTATVLPRTPGRDLGGVVVSGDASMEGQEIWAAGEILVLRATVAMRNLLFCRNWERG